MPIPSRTTADPLPPPVINRQVRTIALAAGLHQHTPVDECWTTEEILQHLCEQHQAFLLVNFRCAKVPVPSWLKDSEDLYAEMPDEVRQLYSLHAIADAPVRNRLKLYSTLKSQDAVICCIPPANKGAADCLNEARLYLAWLARPSVLRMALRSGSGEFCSGLLKAFAGFVISGEAKSTSWNLYAASEMPPGRFGLTGVNGTRGRIQNAPAASHGIVR